MGDRQLDLLAGTLDVLVLQCLSRETRLHGYDLIQRIADRSGHAFQVEEGAIYPALHRLELRRWLASEWGVSDNNRRAKYYRLTARGRRRLDEQKVEWQRLASVMARALELV